MKNKEKRKANNEAEEEWMLEEDKQYRKRPRAMGWVSEIFGALTVILFCLTINIWGRIVLWDKWTLPLAVLFLGQLICLIWYRYRLHVNRHRDDDDDEMETAEQPDEQRWEDV